MQAWAQLHECYTATVERCQAIGTTAPATPTNYLAGYQTLTNIKSRLSAVIPSFVNHTLLDATTPVASNYFLANPGFSATVPVYTVTGLLSYLKLPTNFFAYSPYLGASGLGAYTNDATVPYAHGQTNSFTITGGTNFPTSRTNWYDTDYGFAAIPTIISNLLWTSFTTTAVATNRFYGFGEEPTWAATKAEAEGAYAPLSGSPALYVVGSYGLYLAGIKWNAKLFTADFRCQTTTLPTNFGTCSIEWYAWSTNADTVVDAPVYDPLGLPLISNVYAYVGLATSTNSSTNLLVYGNTNRPAWCADPPASYNGESSLGFWGTTFANALRAIVRWDFTFTYK
jgi:hypothetical protein